MSHIRYELSADIDETIGGVSIAGEVKKKEGVGAMSHMRYLGSYAIVQLTDGSGWYEDERGYRSKMSKGDVLVLHPDVGHRYGPGTGEFWDELYLVFSGPLFEMWANAGYLRSGLWRGEADSMLEWSRELKEVIRVHGQDQFKLVGALQVLVAKLGEISFSGGLTAKQGHWVTIAMKQLAGSEKELQKIADELGMSYEHFRKSFKKEVGLSPLQYRNKQLAVRAYHLLVGSEKPVKEIARILGFYDDAYFSRFFKKYYGVAPNEVRSI